MGNEMKLIDVEVKGTGQSAIIYGAPKCGKTELVGELAKKFNVTWLDLESGFLTLKKLPPEAQARIELIRVKDTKDTPIAVETVLRVLSGAKVSICDGHGKVNCPKCKLAELPFVKIETNTFGPDDLLVIDSLTQLSDSAMAKATAGLGELEKVEFKHYDFQGIFLSKALGLVQQANYNIAVISHELGIELDDKSEKIVPCGGTKNFARKVAKYFDHVVHMTVKNRKHIAESRSTANPKILTGSRTDVAIEDDPDMLLVSIFEGKVAKPKGSGSGSSSKPSPGKQALLDKLKAGKK